MTTTIPAFHFSALSNRPSAYAVSIRHERGGVAFATVYKTLVCRTPTWMIEGHTTPFETRAAAAEAAWRAAEATRLAREAAWLAAEDDAIENAMDAPIVDDAGGADWEPDMTDEDAHRRLDAEGEEPIVDDAGGLSGRDALDAEIDAALRSDGDEEPTCDPKTGFARPAGATRRTLRDPAPTDEDVAEALRVLARYFVESECGGPVPTSLLRHAQTWPDSRMLLVLCQEFLGDHALEFTDLVQGFALKTL